MEEAEERSMTVAVEVEEHWTMATGEAEERWMKVVVEEVEEDWQQQGEVVQVVSSMVEEVEEHCLLVLLEATAEEQVVPSENRFLGAEAEAAPARDWESEEEDENRGRREERRTCGSGSRARGVSWLDEEAEEDRVLMLLALRLVFASFAQCVRICRHQPREEEH